MNTHEQFELFCNRRNSRCATAVWCPMRRLYVTSIRSCEVMHMVDRVAEDPSKFGSCFPRCLVDMVLSMKRCLIRTTSAGRLPFGAKPRLGHFDRSL
jgi:hypothetical protein